MHVAGRRADDPGQDTQVLPWLQQHTYSYIYTVIGAAKGEASKYESIGEGCCIVLLPPMLDRCHKWPLGSCEAKATDTFSDDGGHLDEFG